MNPTDLNLFFVQCMLQPVNPLAWTNFLARQRVRVRLDKPERTRRARERYAASPERARAQRHAIYWADPEKARARCQDWRLKNIERSRKNARNRKRARCVESPEYKLAGNLRTRIYQALKGHTKSARTFELLGMEVPEFKIYLQGQFLPGMTWKNYGTVWELDHIKPCVSFELSDPMQQQECFNWSNCQPLFVSDNRKKGACYVSH